MMMMRMRKRKISKRSQMRNIMSSEREERGGGRGVGRHEIS
jgi:hypothetical protein